MAIVAILKTLRDNSDKLKFLWWFSLAVLVIASVFVHAHHPHFSWEKYPGAWGVFGFIVSVLLILIMKKIVYPLISRPEGHYEC